MNSRLKYKFDVVIVGDQGVGKLSLMSRFVEDTYDDDEWCSPFRLSSWAIDLDGKTVDLTIQATTGEKRKRPKERSKLAHANGFVVAYDCTNMESFKNLPEWMQELDKYGPKNANRILVGTKCDLNRRRAVDYTSAKSYADQHQMMFFETSSKKATNVEQAFVALATQMKNKVDLAALPAITTGHRAIKRPNTSSVSRQDKKLRSDIDEGHAADLEKWSNELKKHQESTMKIFDELTARLEKVASSIATVGEKITVAVDEMSNIEDKFTATVEGVEKREEKKETAEEGDNSLCESCERKVKLRLKKECNIL